MSDRVYLDSCVFLSYLMEIPDRIGVLESVFDEAKRPNGTLEIYTSTLSIAEVAYVVDLYGKADLKAEAFQKIDAMWDDFRIRIVEAHRGTGEHARDIMRNKALAMRPSDDKPKPRTRAADLIHLGTARSMGIREVWTYDGPLAKFAGTIPDLNIVEPYASRPRLPGVT